MNCQKTIIKAKQEVRTHMCKNKTDLFRKANKQIFENYLGITFVNYHQYFLQLTQILDKMFWQI